MKTYEIFLNNNLIETIPGSLSGLAFIKFDSAVLLGDAKLIRVRKVEGDPILSGRFAYNYDTGGWE